MKKKLTLIMVLFSIIATSVAQNQMCEKNFTLVEQREELHPEIVEDLSFDFKHFQHPSHPENGAVCVVWGTLSTLEPYSQYLWEVDEEFLP